MPIGIKVFCQEIKNNAQNYNVDNYSSRFFYHYNREVFFAIKSQSIFSTVSQYVS